MWGKKLITPNVLLTCCNCKTPARIQPLPFFNFIHYCRELSLKQAAAHFLWGHSCEVMIAGEALGYKSIPTSVLSLRGRGRIFGALTKVWHVWFFFFTSASSASHSLRLVLISVSCGEWGWGRRERESRGQLLWFVRNTSFHGELGEEGGRKELKHIIMQPGPGVCVCVCASIHKRVRLLFC